MRASVCTQVLFSAGAFKLAHTQRPQSPLASARDYMPPHATAQRDAACQSLSRKSVEAEQDAGNQTLVQGIRAHLVAAAAIRCVHVDLQPAGTAAEANRLCLLAALCGKCSHMKDTEVFNTNRAVRGQQRTP